MMWLTRIAFFCVLSIHSVVTVADKTSISLDAQGYLVYCPCMGRFGNQADQFLGALAFAKALNRTLVLPPWIRYLPPTVQPYTRFIPFESWFNVSVIQDFTKAIVMEDFMNNLAPLIWPPMERVAFCYQFRSPLTPGGEEDGGCHAKDGNPFGPFWDSFDVSFQGGSRFYAPLTYDAHRSENIQEWQKRFPASEFPVLAFTGAPGSFPVQEENVGLQAYVKWNHEMTSKALEVMKNSFPPGPFIGLHLRNGGDWGRACQHIDSTSNLFSSAQCVGYRREYGAATLEMCQPSKDTILRQVKRKIREISAKAIYVASDQDDMHSVFESEIGLRMGVQVISGHRDSPELDLLILGRSNHFIGNCISSFSAFVVRERQNLGLPFSFWAFPNRSHQGKDEHSEL